MPEPTAGALKFIDQFTRKRMVDWAKEQLVTDRPPIIPDGEKIFRNHAMSKKWISAKDGSVLSAGWEVAAAFLRR